MSVIDIHLDYGFDRLADRGGGVALESLESVHGGISCK